MSQTQSSCTNVSVKISLKRNDTDKLDFEVTKACGENGQGSSYKIKFVFSKKKEDGTYEERISIEVDFSKQAPGNEEAAEKTVTEGFTQRQMDIVRTRVAKRADAVLEPSREILALYGESLEVDFSKDDAAAEALFAKLDEANDRNPKMKRLVDSLAYTVQLH